MRHLSHQSVRPCRERQRQQRFLFEFMRLGRTGRGARARRTLHRAHRNVRKISFDAWQNVRERTHVRRFFLHPDDFARVWMAGDFRAQFVFRKRIKLVEKQDRGIRIAAKLALSRAIRGRFFRCKSGCARRTSLRGRAPPIQIATARNPRSAKTHQDVAACSSA